jgi:hypothetical protein
MTQTQKWNPLIRAISPTEWEMNCGEWRAIVYPALGVNPGAYQHRAIRASVLNGGRLVWTSKFDTERGAKNAATQYIQRQSAYFSGEPS